MSPSKVTHEFDPVLYWNNALLDTIRQVGGPPTSLSRAGAIVHLAMHDAAVAAACAGTPYLLRAVPPTDGIMPSIEAAINQAAFDTLRMLFGDRDYAGTFDEATRNLDPALTPLQVVRGTSVGALAAETILKARVNDGSENDTPYAAELTPGAWRPTGSGPAAGPNWGLVRPFALTSGDQFRPAPPNEADGYEKLLSSSLYERNVEEVRRLGERFSIERTEDETQIAFFWANDLDGTYKPPGQHFEHTQILAVQQNLSLLERVRLFALVAMAMADAAIAAWDAKYQTPIDLWRPESAIHHAARDGRPNTAEDDAWQPLSQDRKGVSFSPPFPAYVSGHATLAGAWAAVMRLYFERDDIEFTATTDDPHAAGVTRRYTSFTEAAEEDARSRVFLGVHYQFDADAGVDTGTDVGAYVFANFLQD